MEGGGGERGLEDKEGETTGREGRNERERTSGGEERSGNEVESNSKRHCKLGVSVGIQFRIQ